MRKLFFYGMMIDRFFRIGRFSSEQIKIQSSIGCLKIIKVFRSTVLHILGMCFCMSLFISGILLIHLMILFFAPWEQTTRLIITMVFIFLYFFISGGLFLYLLSQKKWVELFHIEPLLDQLTQHYYRH